MFTHLHLRINSMITWVRDTFTPLAISGLILWSRVRNESRSNWQRETFQLDNEVLIDGLTKDLQYPLFSGANDNLERVTLDSTITLDCTVGWRLSFYVLGNGDWLSGGGFGVAGNSNSALGYIRISTNGIIVINDGTNGRAVASSMLTQKKYKVDIVCDGVNFVVYIDDELSATNPITTLTTINVNIIGNVAGYEAQGLLFDIKINDVDDSENWTHHYTGINGDWSDQIKKNQKALFQIDGDKVDLDTSILLDSSVGFRVQFYIKESNSTNSGVLGQDDKNGSGIWFNDIPELRLNDGVNEVTLTHNLSVNTNHLVDIICDTVNIELYVDSVLVDTQPIGSLGVLTIDAIGEGRNIITTGNLWGVKINNLNHTDSWTDQYDGINSDWNNKISSNNGTAGVSLDQTYPIPEDSDNIGFDIDGYPIRELPYYNHGTAGANLKYIKNNHNNLKAKTGGYYVANSATGDYIDIPEITLSDLTYNFWYKHSTGTKVIFGSLAGSHYLVVTDISLRFRAGSVDNYDVSYSNDFNWHLYTCVRSGSVVYWYVDGVFISSVNATSGNLVIHTIARTVSVFYDVQIKDVSIFNSVFSTDQIAKLYNNQQKFVELSREYGAERIYDFNIGNGEVGYPVWDLSGNNQHGTIQSNSAPAGTNFIYNDAEVGTQQVLESRNYTQNKFPYSADFENAAWTKLRGTLTSGQSDPDGGTNAFKFQQDALETLIPVIRQGHNSEINKVYTIRVKAKKGTNRDYIQIAELVLDGTTNTTTFDISTGIVLNANPDHIASITDLGNGWYDCKISFTCTASQTVRSIDFRPAVDTTSSVPDDQGFAYLYQPQFYESTEDVLFYETGATGINNWLFIPESANKGIDLFGNAITDQWKRGLLNFTGLDLLDNAHGGVEFGDQIDTLDVSEGRVIAFAFDFVDNGANQYIAGNRNANDGFSFYVDAVNKRIIYLNEVGASASFLFGNTNDLVASNSYYGILTHIGTSVSYYLAQVGTPLPSTPNKTSTVGAIGSGSLIPVIGLRAGSLISPFASLMTCPQYLDKASITEAERNNLANYLKSLIS